MVEPHSSNFRVINTFSFSGVRIFGNLRYKQRYTRGDKHGNQSEYRKNRKISEAQKVAVITLKVEQDGFSLE